MEDVKQTTDMLVSEKSGVTEEVAKLYYLGIWKHMRTGNIYKLVSFSRCVKTLQIKANYKQLYESILVNGKKNINLPVGSDWSRDLSDFLQKFECLQPDGIPFIYDSQAEDVFTQDKMIKSHFLDSHKMLECAVQVFCKQFLRLTNLSGSGNAPQDTKLMYQDLCSETAANIYKHKGKKQYDVIIICDCRGWQIIQKYSKLSLFQCVDKIAKLSKQSECRKLHDYLKTVKGLWLDTLSFNQCAQHFCGNLITGWSRFATAYQRNNLAKKIQTYTQPKNEKSPLSIEEFVAYLQEEGWTLCN